MSDLLLSKKTMKGPTGGKGAGRLDGAGWSGGDDKGAGGCRAATARLKCRPLSHERAVTAPAGEPPVNVMTIRANAVRFRMLSHIFNRSISPKSKPGAGWCLRPVV